MSRVCVRVPNWLGDAVMSLPALRAIRLDGIEPARESGFAQLASFGLPGPVIGIGPGAAYGNAKRWLPERFAEAARAFLPGSPAVLIFGSRSEHALCEEVAAGLR